MFFWNILRCCPKLWEPTHPRISNETWKFELLQLISRQVIVFCKSSKCYFPLGTRLSMLTANSSFAKEFLTLTGKCLADYAHIESEIPIGTERSQRTSRLKFPSNSLAFCVTELKGCVDLTQFECVLKFWKFHNFSKYSRWFPNFASSHIQGFVTRPGNLRFQNLSVAMLPFSENLKNVITFKAQNYPCSRQIAVLPKNFSRLLVST